MAENHIVRRTWRSGGCGLGFRRKIAGLLLVCLCAVACSSEDGQEDTDTTPLIAFSDKAFFNYLLQEGQIDRNNDGQISRKEAACVEMIDMHGDIPVESMSELQYFIGLKEINLSKLPNLRQLDLSYCNKLEVVSCVELEKLDSLVVNRGVRILSCTSCGMKEVSLKGCGELVFADFSGCILDSLDVSDCLKLQELLAAGCGLQALDLSRNTELKELVLDGNRFRKINLRLNVGLEKCSLKGMGSTVEEIVLPAVADTDRNGWRDEVVSEYMEKVKFQ